MANNSGFGGVGKSRAYYQYNYIDIIQKLVPSMYIDTDSSLYGNEEDILYGILGKILGAAQGIQGILPLSAYDASSYKKHFIPRNDLTNLKPHLFEGKILAAFQRKLTDFGSSTEFGDFVSGTVLPEITRNQPTSTFVSAVSANVNSEVSSVEIAHQYLIDSLSWVYFLNSDGPAGGFAPSSVVKDLLVSSTYLGKDITERDGVAGMFEYLWRNRHEYTSSSTAYLPTDFSRTSGDVSSSLYASGDQQLAGLKTLLSVWYNPDDEASTELGDQLALLDSLGSYGSKTIPGGPFQKFLKAISFAFYDVNAIVEDVGNLIDIERVDPKFMEYLASLIGWKVLTGDVDRWRGQLRQAVYLYKSKGTRKSLETAMGLMFPSADFDFAAAAQETWESFFPRLIYYLIATESKVLNDPNYDPTNSIANSTMVSIGGENAIRQIDGTPLYDADNHDNNYRFATDYVLSSLNYDKSAITINGVVYSPATWDPGNPEFPGFAHRGALVSVPPWENDRFYDTTHFTTEQISFVSSLLTEDRNKGGLEVSSVYTDKLAAHIWDHTKDSSLLNGLNVKWKFFSPSAIQPPNFSSVTAELRSKDLSLKDYWNSKSSTIISEIATSSIKYVINKSVSGTYGYQMPLDQIMYVVADVFRQFIPFHTSIRLSGKDVFVEDYEAGGNVDGLSFHLKLIDPLDSDTFVFTDNISSGTIASSVTGLDAPSSVQVSYASVPRLSKRRRNLRYVLPGGPAHREGKSMPIARHISVSGDVSAFSSLNNTMNLSSFSPLGLNFSSGAFFSTTGTYKWIYDTSNDLALTGLSTEFESNSRGSSNLKDVSASYGGLNISATFPTRALGMVSSLGTAGPITRSPASIATTAVYGLLIKDQLTNDTAISLNASSVENVRLGDEFHRAYIDHHRYLGKNFNHKFTAINASSYTDSYIKAGGKSFGAHAFGPLVYNHDFNTPGQLNLGDFNDLSAYNGGATKLSDSQYNQWRHLIGSPESAAETYSNYEGGIVTIQTPSTDTTANQSVVTRPYHEQFLIAGGEESVRSVDTLASGISFFCNSTDSNAKSWAVYNNFTSSVANGIPPDTTVTTDYVTSPGTISLFTLNVANQSAEYTSRTSCRISFPLNQGRQFLVNHDFRYLPDDTGGWMNVESTKLISGWALQAANTDLKDGNAWPTGLGSISSVLSGTNDLEDVYHVSAHVTGAGTYKNGNSAALEYTFDTDKGGDPYTIRGFIPGRKYTLEVEAMSPDPDCSGIEVQLTRHSGRGNGIFYLSSTGVFIHEDDFSTLGGNYPNVIVGTDVFKSWSLDFSTSSLFTENDGYTLRLLPHGPYDGGFKATYNDVMIRKVSIKEADSHPTKNRLMPERNYSIKVKARESLWETSKSEQLGIRIRTENTPNFLNFENKYGRDPASSDYRPITFGFNFDTDRWESYDQHDFLDPGTGTMLNSMFYKATLKDHNVDANGWSTIDLSFHTDNKDTDQWDDYSTRSYITQIVKSGHPVHTVDTVYHIDLCKLTGSTDNTSYVTLDSISVSADHYKGITESFGYTGLESLFDVFDKTTSGDASRDASSTSGTYLTSGGSRISYESKFGGEFSGLGEGHQGIYGDTTSGVIYEIDDD